MEHRCSERVNTDHKVLIYKMGIPVAIGRLKNGSKLGFFVETDFADINILQLLDVEVLLYRGPQQLDRFKFTTRVIRKDDAGMGLELEQMSNESALALDDILRGSCNNNHQAVIPEQLLPEAKAAVTVPKRVVQGSGKRVQIH